MYPAGGDVTTALDVAGLLAEAATAIHAERDAGRLVVWVLDRARAATGADAAGLWLLDNGTMTWSRTGSAQLDPTVLGDLRSWATLAAALNDGTIVHGDLDVGRRFGGA